MYVGRCVAVGKLSTNEIAIAYRLASRSFPDRTIVVKDDTARVFRAVKADTISNPFLEYRCLKVTPDIAVVSNGNHTEPICDRVAEGVPPVLALSLVLTALGYEQDGFGTPCIAAVADRRSEIGWLGMISKDGVEVRCCPMVPGQMAVIATNEWTRPGQKRLPIYAVDSGTLAREVLAAGPWSDLQCGIAAAAVVGSNSGWSTIGISANVSVEWI